MRNMGNYKSLITAFLLLLVSSHLYAEGEIPGEGYAQNTEIQNNRAAIAKAVSNPNYITTVNSTYDATNKDIVARYSTSFTNPETGTKSVATATVKKSVNKVAVAETMAGRFLKDLARGTPSSIVGGLVVYGIIEGAGWAIDELKGQVTRTADSSSITCNSSGSDCTFANYIYLYNNVYYSSQITACTLAFKSSYPNVTGYTAVDWPSFQQPNSTCRFQTSSGTYTTYGGLSVLAITNSNYSSTATQPTVEVNTSELATKIAEQLDKTDQTAEENNRKLIGAAYTADPTFDLSDDSINKLSKQIGSDVASALQNAANSPTRKYSNTDANGTTVNAEIKPASTTATGTTTGTGTTTTNPDGSTTTETQTSSQFQMPAFCSWASIMCDWYKYTQEKYEEVKTAITDFVKAPDATDTALDIDTETDTQDAPILNFGGQCPASIQLASGQIAGIDIDWQFDFTDFCTVLSTYVRPILIAMGAFIAILILGGVRTTDD